MLRLYQSNHMSSLTEMLMQRAQQFSEGPLTRQTVVVQSFGIGQWLKLAIAEREGIAGNMDCILPAHLIWKLYEWFLEREVIPDSSPFARELLAWRLMPLLQDNRSPEFRPVADYLEGPGDPQVRLYQLSGQIAALYDQYLIYRPDWITAWENGDDPIVDENMAAHGWQQSLWRELIGQPDLSARYHRASLHRALSAALDQCTTPPAHLPRHISVFGLSSIPPMHLDALRQVATIVDVDIFFLNPCQHYWGDIVSARDVARRSIRELTGGAEPLTDEAYLETGNPLLSSMGKEGREFLELLMAMDEIETVEAFADNDEDTMLGFLQNDILRMEFGGDFGSVMNPQPRPPAPGDRSIQIHSCHSRLREVEVLYDQLLTMFSEHDDLEPRDIMVMMPNVGDYAPYIHAVFRNKLFYSVADRSADEESPILASFMKLLALPHSRLTTTEVMDYLEVPAIARRFDLDEDDLARIAARIDEAGIRFETDGHAKQERWDLPSTDHNTWKFGLDRMLAGFAMESENGVYKNILPMDITGDEGRLVGVLCHFVSLLDHYRDELDKAKPADDWLRTITLLIRDIFSPWGDEELDLDQIHMALSRLVEETTETGFDQPISLELFRHWMTAQFDTASDNRAFITGGITFGTLIPMRSIPFKVICLLGMNDNEYPRQSSPVSFDLIRLEGEQKGDRSRRNDDRYLFLEALISARRIFYASYAGRSLKDNSEKAPSVLVSELIDYCRTIFQQDCVVQHPLQPFNSDYFDPDHEDLRSWNDKWYQALENTRPRPPFISAPLAGVDQQSLVELEELIRFYRHPARYFLRTRLGVYFQDDDLELKEAEPFAPDALERYQLSDSALSCILEGQDQETWQERMTASGVVMANAVGRQHLAAEFDKARSIYEEMAPHLAHEERKYVDRLTIGSLELSGHVEGIHDNTLLDARTGQLRRRQLLQAWLKHLFLNAAGQQVETVMISQSKGVTLPALDEESARGHLSALVEHFNAGLCRPLPLVPEMSFAFAEAITKGDSRDNARKLALRAWFSDRPGAEGQDADYRRCFAFPEALDESFEEIALGVALPVLKAIES
ncbi:MAG: exodeoxyribonuclease V subunit gamma [Pseudomonadales bacterium]|nr:exodeoxyribonuclease V subunit gamma [Pseudomonadales bacterium]